MKIKARTALATAALTLAAAPAFAAGPSSIPPGYDGQTNPGTAQQPASIPPGYDSQNNPGTANQPSDVPPGYDGQNNPGATHGLSNPQARALGRTACQQFKTNFKVNKSAFGRCIAAAASAARGDQTPTQACKDRRLSRTRHDGQARSDFRACVLAASRARHQAETS